MPKKYPTRIKLFIALAKKKKGILFFVVARRIIEKKLVTFLGIIEIAFDYFLVKIMYD